MEEEMAALVAMVETVDTFIYFDYFRRFLRWRRRRPQLQWWTTSPTAQLSSERDQEQTQSTEF